MRPGALAEELVQTAWVPPTGTALLALTRGGSTAWTTVRHDPGLLLTLLQIPAFAPLLTHSFPAASLLDSPDLLEAVLQRLRSSGEAHLVDWSDARRQPILTICRQYAALAHALAIRHGGCDPERAWTTALLAPLGWITLAVQAPTEAEHCLADPSWKEVPARSEIARWGLDQSELTRRLARQWRLPEWLTAVISHLGLPVDVAVRLGADPLLFQLTQLAVGRVQQRGQGLGLPLGAPPGELLRELGLTGPLGEWGEDPLPEQGPGPSLVEFLGLEAENRRLRGRETIHRLEQELDILHRTLEEQRSREESRLRESKLRALAEFAAGAGHEINNPLAVISCQAQLLLHQEAEPARRTSLEKIIGQTQRIHTLLRELMQFARPATPIKQSLDLVRLLDEVGTALQPLAQQQGVRLSVRDEAEGGTPPVAPPLCLIEADEKQVRTALTCLVKNAIQAAGAEGWVRVRIVEVRERIEVRIEDSGPGVSSVQREHLYDPFFSGRSAGRGPGLGLPTAWSLARQQGGEVELTSPPGETTCFVLRLPRQSEQGTSLAG